MAESEQRDAFVRRLSHFLPLSDAEVEGICSLAGDNKPVRKGEILGREDERQPGALLLWEGWAARYRHLENGKRQIISFVLPGDFCDPNNFVLARLDYSMQAITDGVVCHVTANRIFDIVDRHPRIAIALWWGAAFEEMLLRQRLVALGGQDAYYRAAHLFYELVRRLELSGQSGRHDFPLPITQVDLADSLGVTPEYVSRLLSRFRAEGVLEIEDKTIRIADREKLTELAEPVLALSKDPDVPSGIRERFGLP